MTTLYLGNLPFSATASGVRGLFEQNGPALIVETRGHREPPPPRGGPPERDSRR
jgi:RNA recognition motif-containing protein